MNGRQWAALAVVLALLGLTTGVLTRLSARQRLGQPGLKLVNEPTYETGGRVAHTNSVYLPLHVLDYASKPQEVTTLELNWLPKDTLFGRRQYQSAMDGFPVFVSVVLMGTDRTSIHKPQYCLDGQGWHIDKSETAVVPIPRPYPYDLRVMKLTTSRDFREQNGRVEKWRGIYVYWFVSEDQLTASHIERMWWMARDLVTTGVLKRWAYVTYFAVCRPGQEDATFHRMREFIAASVPEFQLTAGSRKSAASIVFTSPISGGYNGHDRY